MVEYWLGQSGVGQRGVKNGWDIKSGGQDRGRRVMGYGEGERAGNPKCCEDGCYIQGSVEEGDRGAPGESIIPEFQSPAAPGANQRQLEADSTSYSYL